MYRSELTKNLGIVTAVSGAVTIGLLIKDTMDLNAEVGLLSEALASLDEVPVVGLIDEVVA